MDSRDEANLKLIEEEHAEFDYKEMWEDGKVQEVQSDPQRLSDAIADANTLDYDVYTAALSELLETIHTDDLPTSAMALSVVIENIIITHINRHNAYDEHIKELREENAADKLYLKLLDLNS
tara:strand:- start:223 stop:588 length:366 start_codon:yes stop_codon:yes gene_type:complete